MNEKTDIAVLGMIRTLMGTGNAAVLNACNMGMEALEKQIPMEVTDVHVDEYYCPACGAENGCCDGRVEDNYCPRCGQALRWEE